MRVRRREGGVEYTTKDEDCSRVHRPEEKLWGLGERDTPTNGPMTTQSHCESGDVPRGTDDRQVCRENRTGLGRVNCVTTLEKTNETSK